MKKVYSLPNIVVDYVKAEADKRELAQSDMLRRIIDFYKEANKEKTNETK